VSSQYKASVKAFEAKGTSFKGETQTRIYGVATEPVTIRDLRQHVSETPEGGWC
jgi:hypothetical protein